MTDPRREKLVGAVVSMPTFADEEHNLLLDRQRKHTRWLIDNGIRQGSGVLLVAGGYGESYFLEDHELFALIDVVVDEAGTDVSTMVGIFDLSARIAARRARYAADAGVDFIELGLPHYSAPSEEDVFLHHRYVNDNADIGIMTYNNFWVVPPPGFEISRSLIERFTGLENLVGLKWSSASQDHYLDMLKLFSGRFNFIDNAMRSALGARNGMSGFVDFYGNVAPRLSLRLWELSKGERYDELDELLLRVHVGPQQRATTPDSPTFAGVGDGPGGKVRWELMGLDSGPLFPAQATPPKEFVEYTRRIIEAKGGVHEWVDWDQSVLD